MSLVVSQIGRAPFTPLPLSGAGKDPNEFNLTIDDFDGKSIQEAADLIVETFEEGLLHLMDERSPGLQKPIDLLFRIQSADEGLPFCRIMTGRNEYGGQINDELYPGWSLTAGTPQVCTDLDSLFITLGFPEDIAVMIVRKITGVDRYRADEFTEPLKQDAASEKREAPKPELTESQDVVRDDFTGGSRKLAADVNRFLGITGSKNTTHLRQDELDQRVTFLGALLEMSLPDSISLDSEYAGYKKYQSDAYADYREDADRFLNSFGNNFEINNFSNRGKVVEFLKQRVGSGDTEVRGFLENLRVLKTRYQVEGVERSFFDKACKLLFKRDEGDGLYGLYYEASVARAIADKRNGAVVKAVSLNEIPGESGTFNDVDILVERKGHRYFIEVKANTKTATNSKDQISTLTEDAKRHGATPVIIAGDVNAAINRADSYLSSASELSSNNIQASTNRAITRIQSLGEMLAENSSLQIWNEEGSDLTKTVRELAASLANL